jgi:hypothetical protein
MPKHRARVGEDGLHHPHNNIGRPVAGAHPTAAAAAQRAVGKQDQR